MNTSCGGKWLAFDDFVFVLLDKAYPYLGLKAFTIVQNERAFLQGDFLQTAISQIGAAGVYKVGYHDFTYYYYEAAATVYWGSEWSENTLKPKLLYGTAYEFEGWFEDWHPQDSEGERVPLVAKQQMQLVFREDGFCEVYQNGEYKYMTGYRLRVIHDEHITIYFDGSLEIKCENWTYRTNRLQVQAKRLTARTGEYEYQNDVFCERSWSLDFVAP